MSREREQGWGAGMGCRDGEQGWGAGMGYRDGEQGWHGGERAHLLTVWTGFDSSPAPYVG